MIQRNALIIRRSSIYLMLARLNAFFSGPRMKTRLKWYISMAKKEHSTSTYMLASRSSQRAIHTKILSRISNMSDNASHDTKPNVGVQNPNPLEEMHKVFKGKRMISSLKTIFSDCCFVRNVSLQTRSLASKGQVGQTLLAEKGSGRKGCARGIQRDQQIHGLRLGQESSRQRLCGHEEGVGCRTWRQAWESDQCEPSQCRPTSRTHAEGNDWQ